MQWVSHQRQWGLPVISRSWWVGCPAPVPGAWGRLPLIGSLQLPAGQRPGAVEQQAAAVQDRSEQQSKVGWLRSAKHQAAGLQSEKTRSMLGSARRLLCSRSFQAVTAAATLNDIGGWALVSWHATFYTRVFSLKPEMYAPLLAAIIPVGGVIGGVGGGLAGDWLSRRGSRWWLTSGGRLGLPGHLCRGAVPALSRPHNLPDTTCAHTAVLSNWGRWRGQCACGLGNSQQTLQGLLLAGQGLSWRPKQCVCMHRLLPEHAQAAKQCCISRRGGAVRARSGIQGKTIQEPPAATGPLISGASHPLQVPPWRPHP